MLKNILIGIISIVPAILSAQETISLEDILILASKQNLDLQSERQNVKIVSARKLIDVTPENPTIFVERGEIRNGRSNDQAIGISQSFSFPMVYLQKHKKYSLDRRIADQEFELLKSGIQLRAFLTALEYLILEKRVKYFDQNRQNLQKVFLQDKRRFESGEISKLSFLKSKVAFSAINTDLQNLRLDQSRVLRDLQTLLNSDNPLRPVGEVSTDTGFIYMQAKHDFVESHPLIRIHDLSIKRLRINKSLSYYSVLPAFDLQIKKQHVDKTNMWGFEVGISVPLWIGTSAGQVRKASTILDQARLQRLAAENSVNLEYDAIWTEYRQAKNSFSLYITELLPEAQEIFRVAERSYHEGQVSYLEFADAYQIKLATENRYLDVLFDLNRATAKLHRYQLDKYLKPIGKGKDQ